MSEQDPQYGVAGPPGWTRRAMDIYSAPSPPPASGIAPNVVLMREALPGDEPARRGDQLMAYAQGQIRSMTPQLREPAFDPPERLVYRDVPVVRVNVVWLSGTTRVRQWIVFFPLGNAHVLVATATAAEAEFRDYAKTFADLLGSVTLPA